MAGSIPAGNGLKLGSVDIDAFKINMAFLDHQIDKLGQKLVSVLANRVAVSIDRGVIRGFLALQQVSIRIPVFNDGSNDPVSGWIIPDFDSTRRCRLIASAVTV